MVPTWGKLCQGHQCSEFVAKGFHVKLLKRVRGHAVGEVAVFIISYSICRCGLD